MAIIVATILFMLSPMVVFEEDVANYYNVYKLDIFSFESLGSDLQFKTFSTWRINFIPIILFSFLSEFTNIFTFYYALLVLQIFLLYKGLLAFKSHHKLSYVFFIPLYFHVAISLFYTLRQNISLSLAVIIFFSSLSFLKKRIYYLICAILIHPIAFLVLIHEFVLSKPAYIRFFSYIGFLIVVGTYSQLKLSSEASLEGLNDIQIRWLIYIFGYLALLYITHKRIYLNSAVNDLPILGSIGFILLSGFFFPSYYSRLIFPFALLLFLGWGGEKRFYNFSGLFGVSVFLVYSYITFSSSWLYYTIN